MISEAVLITLHFCQFQPEVPSVKLGFSDNATEILEVNDQGKIVQSIVKIPANPTEILVNHGLSSLDLLSTVVPFTIADATCDLSYHRNQMDEAIQAFGLYFRHSIFVAYLQDQ